VRPSQWATGQSSAFSSIDTLRLYQLVFGHWGDDMPADLVGALAMVAVTVLFTWIGWLIRSARTRRAVATP
jgi:hypothetical protein